MEPVFEDETLTISRLRVRKNGDWWTLDGAYNADGEVLSSPDYWEYPSFEECIHWMTHFVEMLTEYGYTFNWRTK
jgi:hypothetical protein